MCDIFKKWVHYHSTFFSGTTVIINIGIITILQGVIHSTLFENNRHILNILGKVIGIEMRIWEYDHRQKI